MSFELPPPHADSYLERCRRQPAPDLTYTSKTLADHILGAPLSRADAMNGIATQMSPIQAMGDMDRVGADQEAMSSPSKALKNSELPAKDNYKIEIPLLSEKVREQWDSGVFSPPNMPIPSQWLRIPVPSRAAPDAVRFDIVPGAFTGNDRGIFAYLTIPSKNIIAFSTEFVASRHLVEAYAKLHKTSLTTTTESEVIERLGERGLRPSDRGLDSFSIAKSAEALVIVRVSPSDGKARGVLEFAASTPFAFSTSSFATDLAKGTLGFAEVTILPEKAGAVFIDFAAAKKSIYVSSVLESVFIVVPSDYSPKIRLRLAFPSREKLEQGSELTSRENVWLTTAISQFGFGSPVPFYSIQSVRSGEDVGPESISGIELTSLRTLEARKMYGARSAVSSGVLALAIRGVAEKAQSVLTRMSGGRGVDSVQEPGVIELPPDVVRVIRKKYGDLISEYDVCGTFATQAGALPQLRLDEGQVEATPMISEELEKSPWLREVKIQKRETKSPRSHTFVVRSAETGSPSVQDVATVAEGSAHNLSCHFIFTKEGVFSMAPSPELVLFTKMFRDAAASEDLAAKALSSQEKTEEESTELLGWRTLVSGVAQAGPCKGDFSKEEWANQVRALTLQEVTKGKGMNARGNEYLKQMSNFFDRSILHTQESHGKFPLFHADYTPWFKAEALGVQARRV
jgi:hypothetical protein